MVADFILGIDHEDSSMFNLDFSILAIFWLVWGFRRIRAESRGWILVLLGVLCTLAIPFTGFYVRGLMEALSAGNGIIEAIAKGFIAAIILGILGASLFTLPFMVANTLSFYLYRRDLRRSIVRRNLLML